MADWTNFCGGSYVARTIYQNDEELINGYIENDPTKMASSLIQAGERGKNVIQGTPGLSALMTPGPIAPVRGLYTAPGGTVLWAVIGQNVYYVRPSPPTAFLAGVLTGAATTPVKITDNNVNVYLTDGANRYFAPAQGGALTTIAPSDGPWQGASICDEVDEFIVYDNPGTQQWGCTNAGSTTSGSTNFSVKDSSGDNLVALIVDHREVRLFGERTSETWIDAGTFPFPFQRIPGASMQHGIAAKYSFARLGETCAFLSKDDRGQAIVVQMNGYNAQRISTHAVEQAISKYSTVSDAIGMTYQSGGHEFYFLTFPTADATWCFDLAANLWHKRGWFDTFGVMHRHRANCFALWQGAIVVGDWQNGQLMTFSDTNYTDLGQPLPLIRRAPHLNKELKLAFYHDLQIQFEPGVGLQSGQGSVPQAMLKWSNDGGKTFGAEIWQPIGQVGQYKNRCRWTALSASRDRVFEVKVTDPVYRTIVSAELNFTLGEV